MVNFQPSWFNIVVHCLNFSPDWGIRLSVENFVCVFVDVFVCWLVIANIGSNGLKRYYKVRKHSLEGTDDSQCILIPWKTVALSRCVIFPDLSQYLSHIPKAPPHLPLLFCARSTRNIPSHIQASNTNVNKEFRLCACDTKYLHEIQIEVVLKGTETFLFLPNEKFHLLSVSTNHKYRA